MGSRFCRLRVASECWGIIGKCRWCWKGLGCMNVRSGPSKIPLRSEPCAQGNSWDEKTTQCYKDFPLYFPLRVSWCISFLPQNGRKYFQIMYLTRDYLIKDYPEYLVKNSYISITTPPQKKNPIKNGQRTWLIFLQRRWLITTWNRAQQT